MMRFTNAFTEWTEAMALRCYRMAAERGCDESFNILEKRLDKNDLTIFLLERLAFRHGDADALDWLTDRDPVLSTRCKEECAICLKAMCFDDKKLRATPCRHVFHQACLKGLEVCPLCREEL